MAYSHGFGRKQVRIEYLVRRHSDVEFQVKKIADGETLLEAYTVTVPRDLSSKQQPRCDCMAWITGKTRPCKHHGYVARFIQAGEPIPFSINPKE